MLTRDFKKTVQARPLRDPEFRVGLLQDALQAFIDGDLEAGEVLPRNDVNATVGFEDLGAQLYPPPTSLMWLRSAEDNLRADNLFVMMAHLKACERVALSVERAQAGGLRE